MAQIPSQYKEFFEKHREIIMYCIFGVITTIVSWLVYSICQAWLGLNLYYCGIISWILAVIVAFITNKLYVFDSKSWKPALALAEFITFVGGRALTGVLEIVAVPMLVSWGFDATLFGVEGLPAKISMTVVIVILNYILSKFISFNIGKKKK